MDGWVNFKVIHTPFTILISEVCQNLGNIFPTLLFGAVCVHLPFPTACLMIISLCVFDHGKVCRGQQAEGHGVFNHQQTLLFSVCPNRYIENQAHLENITELDLVYYRELKNL